MAVHDHAAALLAEGREIIRWILSHYQEGRWVLKGVQEVLDGKKKLQRTKMTTDEKFPLRGFIVCSCGRLLTARTLSAAPGNNRNAPDI